MSYFDLIQTAPQEPIQSFDIEHVISTYLAEEITCCRCMEYGVRLTHIPLTKRYKVYLFEEVWLDTNELEVAIERFNRLSHL
jgi:hypothetical protein